MLTFFDPVILDDIDIHNQEANFYIIQIDGTAGHQKYKVCGTVCDLNSPRMLFDPVTKIQTYWLITREQLNHANLSILFPNDKLRDEPLLITELDEAFKYDPSIPAQQNKSFHFDLMSPPEKFGPKPIRSILHSSSPLSMYGYDPFPWNQALPIHPNIQRLIDLNLMTMNEARLLSKDAAESLGTQEIFTLIQEGKLSLNEAKALTPHNRARLVFLHGLVSNTMTAQAIIDLQLNDGRVSCLRDPGIQLLIHGGQLTIQKAIRLSVEHAFRANETQPLISNGFLSLNDVRTLTHDEVQILNKPPVYNLILQRQITVSQAKALSSQQIDRIRAGHADEVLQHLSQDDASDQNPEDPVSGCRIC